MNEDSAVGLSTPVLLLIHARPETTEKVLASLRSARPRHLYVAADGPREGVEGEAQRCEEARRMATSADWGCNVHTLFRSEHLGLEPAVTAALNWFFNEVPEGIVLEDDCFPSRSFYFFCQDLLDSYRNTPIVMHISGNNFQYGRRRGGASYYFSRYALVWGWATWRRAWDQFRADQSEFGQLAPTWDAQWQKTLERHGGLAIVPNVNLVSNIGFGHDASHTRTLERYSFLPAMEIDLPLVHPEHLAVNRKADVFTYYSHFRNVRNLDLIWFYQLWDRSYKSLKRTKRWMLGQSQS
jgi:hypothetical protein